MQKYCTREYVFPKKAFAGFLWTVSDDDRLLIHNMFQVYGDLDHLIEDAKLYIKEVEDKGIMILDEGIILPLNLKKIFDLREEYWKQPSIEVDSYSKILKNIEMLKMPSAFDLLVTPAGIHEDKEIFSYAFPFFSSSAESDVEAFMLASTHPVPIDAKNSALYEVSGPIGINWTTSSLIKETDNDAQTLKN